MSNAALLSKNRNQLMGKGVAFVPYDEPSATDQIIMAKSYLHKRSAYRGVAFYFTWHLGSVAGYLRLGNVLETCK